MPAKNPAAEFVTVERIAPGGNGIARLPSGEIVFVLASAPGDEVELSELVQRKGLVYAKQSRLRASGPGRVPPTCEHAERCGGCNFMHLSLDAQKQAKLGILEDALRRIGGDPHAGVAIEFVASEASLAYRTRIRLHTNEQGDIGFVRALSNELAVIDHCAVSTPRIDEAITRLARATRSEKKLLSFCKAIELREAADEPRLVARLVPAPKAKLDAARYAPLFPPDTHVMVAGATDEGRVTQRYALPASTELVAPVTAFTQVNHGVNQKLVAAVLDAAARHGVCTFVDAYAGAGNFTLPLLACGLKGEAIDVHAAGIYSARGVARDRGLPFDGFQVGDARSLLDAFVRARRQFDLVLLDPPREGSKRVLQAALQLQPKLVLLVACDPVALARDLKTLVATGGRVEALTVFDMFPQTHHFETLAAVTLSPGPGRGRG
jgi:23S rRNA (uracil1939-C5)-methyltransferase